jgi:CRP-like cAMP-binding protein
MTYPGASGLIPAKPTMLKRRTFLPSGDRLWRIEQGTVRTFSINPDGTLVPLGFWGPGEVLGSMLSSLNSYHMECLTPVQAHLLPTLDSVSSMAEARRSHTIQLEALLQIAHQRQVKDRLFELLQFLADRFGPQLNGPQPHNKFNHGKPLSRSVALALTHQDMADAIGSSRVTVTRTLQVLREEGKINWSGRRYQLAL